MEAPREKRYAICMRRVKRARTTLVRMAFVKTGLKTSISEEPKSIIAQKSNSAALAESLADINNYGPLVKRLRHGPFTAVTWVRFPYGSP